MGELQALPIRVVELAIDGALLEVALRHNLAVYDACYLSLAHTRKLPVATIDGKLQQAAQSLGVQVIRP